MFPIDFFVLNLNPLSASLKSLGPVCKFNAKGQFEGQLMKLGLCVQPKFHVWAIHFLYYFYDSNNASSMCNTSFSWVDQPVTWRDQLIIAVIQLLFKLGGNITYLGR